MFRVTATGGLGVVVIFGRPEHVMPIWLCEQALHTALPDLELPPGNRLQTDPMSPAEAMSTAGFDEQVGAVRATFVAEVLGRTDRTSPSSPSKSSSAQLSAS